MFDLFKSDYAPIESFSNIELERQFKENKVERVVYRDPYSDERNNKTENKELINGYIPPEKKPDPGTSRIESVNTKINKTESSEVKLENIQNGKPKDNEIYTIEKFGREIVCNCGVDVKNASGIIQEVSKKAIMLDKIVSNLKQNQRECVLTKINKLKLSQFPDTAIDDAAFEDALEDALEVVKAEPIKKKEVKLVESENKEKPVKKQIEDEEQGDIFNISHDIFSNEMIIIAVIIAIVVLCMN